VRGATVGACACLLSAFLSPGPSQMLISGNYVDASLVRGLTGGGSGHSLKVRCVSQEPPATRTTLLLKRHAVIWLAWPPHVPWPCKCTCKCKMNFD
jgi:hypothetical protein